eukprot:UN4319
MHKNNGPRCRSLLLDLQRTECRERSNVAHDGRDEDQPPLARGQRLHAAQQGQGYGGGLVEVAGESCMRSGELVHQGVLQDVVDERQHPGEQHRRQRVRVPRHNLPEHLPVCHGGEPRPGAHRVGHRKRRDYEHETRRQGHVARGVQRVDLSDSQGP